MLFAPPDPLPPPSRSFLHTLSQLLADNDYVIILALDFSKAFDTVRHHSFIHSFIHIRLLSVVKTQPNKNYAMQLTRECSMTLQYYDKMI